MGVAHVLPDLTNLNTDVPSQMVNFGYSSDHDGVSYQQLAQTILSGSAADITISSIPQTYGSLWFHIVARSDRAGQLTDQLYSQVNGDNGSNYDRHWLQVNAASTAVTEQLAQIAMYHGEIPGATAAAGLATEIEVLFTDYARSAWQKTARTFNAAKKGTTSGQLTLTLAGGYHRTTDAITSVRFFAQGNLLTDSIVTMYGFA